MPVNGSACAEKVSDVRAGDLPGQLALPCDEQPASASSSGRFPPGSVEEVCVCAAATTCGLRW